MKRENRIQLRNGIKNDVRDNGRGRGLSRKERCRGGTANTLRAIRDRPLQPRAARIERCTRLHARDYSFSGDREFIHARTEPLPEALHTCQWEYLLPIPSPPLFFSLPFSFTPAVSNVAAATKIPIPIS